METTTSSSIPPLATRASMRGCVQCCWAWAGEGISSGTEVVPVSMVAVASPRLSETRPANAAARMHRWSLSIASEGEAQRAAWRDWPCRCRMKTTWGVLVRDADRSTLLSPALERLQRTWPHRRWETYPWLLMPGRPLENGVDTCADTRTMDSVGTEYHGHPPQDCPRGSPRSPPVSLKVKFRRHEREKKNAKKQDGENWRNTGEKHESGYHWTAALLRTAGKCARHLHTSRPGAPMAAPPS